MPTEVMFVQISEIAIMRRSFTVVIMRSHAGLLIRHWEAQQGFTEHPVVAEL